MDLSVSNQSSMVESADMKMALPSLAEVYEAHVDFVWRNLKRLGIPQKDLEDVTHDVFVTLHHVLPTYEKDRPIRPWLFGVVYRVTKDFLKKHAHQKEILETNLESDTQHSLYGGETSRNGTSDEKELVIEALSKLKEEDRVLLILVYIEEYSAPEISTALGWNLHTVYTRLRRARAAFEASVQRIHIIEERESGGST